ncbi:DUF1922 domain-containing protein [Vulcanisaeta sp. JCM 16159]|uniref:DUF1922 domain-containing protein n=1 Tax=Vulcanisaeta sp. JCM 16159 TaxID=1295371 RepID=UPI0006D0F3D6|nr:DUF1922 domain-containing protein [Vulcanisaeta sp. JCM 16159]
MYLIIACPKCGNYSVIRDTVKTHECPYCGYLMRIEEVPIIARARNGREAREIILKLKTPRELRRRP